MEGIDRNEVEKIMEMKAEKHGKENRKVKKDKESEKHEKAKYSNYFVKSDQHLFFIWPSCFSAGSPTVINLLVNHIFPFLLQLMNPLVSNVLPTVALTLFLLP